MKSSDSIESLAVSPEFIILLVSRRFCLSECTTINEVTYAQSYGSVSFVSSLSPTSTMLVFHGLLTLATVLSPTHHYCVGLGLIISTGLSAGFLNSSISKPVWLSTLLLAHLPEACYFPTLYPAAGFHLPFSSSIHKGVWSIHT